jgi:hypothetical protein|nr:MAG TPA: hypothetical protein [Caudoviricetes sp.]
MTLETASIQHNIYMAYCPSSKNEPGGWMWSIECGYQCFDGKIRYSTASECEKG